MTEKQAELISELAAQRHEMHCNIDRLVCDGSYDKIGETLALTNEEIKMSGLPPVCGLDDLSHCLSETMAYIDIDDLDLLNILLGILAHLVGCHLRFDERKFLLPISER